ncbi:hydroxyethylthiazole kinase [Salmonella bongori]|nr:hydroxyethylthiazole kinase [Salmonella bongori]
MFTDGQRTVSIPGGDPLMTRIVGTGCALSAVVLPVVHYLAAALDNVASACCWMKLAGTGCGQSVVRGLAVLSRPFLMRCINWMLEGTDEKH